MVDHAALLRALATVRHDVTSSMARMQIGGPLYQGSAQLLDSIDEVVLLLTGRRDALHAPAHGRR
jgi:hypothetical protein